MAIEAPASKFRKNKLRIFIVALIFLAVWFAYDGWYNKAFIQENTTPEGPNSSLVFNQKAPLFIVAGALLLAVYLFVSRNKKLVADENELIVSDKEKISYDSIEKIDKTHFDSKGFFIITYKNANGTEVNRKVSDGSYDNLAAILDHLVAKIT